MKDEAGRQKVEGAQTTRNPTVDFLALKTFLDTLLHAERFAALEEPNGVYVPPADPAREVRRLGLVLEPTPGWLGWRERETIDALFVHRPWDMGEEGQRALADAGVGALAYHLAFDERLTTGFNPTLAAACGWGEPALIAEKDGRPLGMACALPGGAASFAAVARRVGEVFGGVEEVTPPAGGPGTLVTGAACVGAMNDRCVRAAHAAGAGVYVTGQWRQPARAAVRETGMGVVAIGHARSERWGLRALARLLREGPAGGVEMLIYDGRG